MSMEPFDSIVVLRPPATVYSRRGGPRKHPSSLPRRSTITSETASTKHTHRPESPPNLLYPSAFMPLPLWEKAQMQGSQALIDALARPWLRLCLNRIYDHRRSARGMTSVLQDKSTGASCSPPRHFSSHSTHFPEGREHSHRICLAAADHPASTAAIEAEPAAPAHVQLTLPFFVPDFSASERRPFAFLGRC
ncbi:hypothetical protein BKA80DRAFT_91210 [Phyllosticta citrichinensis]